MKTRLLTLLIAIFASSGIYAQGYYNVRAVGYDISDNLDLEAVSYLFGESRDLQDFEYRLNDPKMQISNLDLNRDGFVDYLRVVEAYEYGIHLITIQAVLDQNIFQDVATIDVERNNRGGFYVQVIGDPYIYGPNYIIEPAYVHAPLIFSLFLRPVYVVWHSPYFWGYYPPRYKHYRCLSTYRYQRYLYRHVDFHIHTYHYRDVRRNSRAVELQRTVRRNDYGTRHPDYSFSKRNSGYKNKYELNRSRSVTDRRLGRGSSAQPTYKNGTRQGSSQRDGKSYRYEGRSNDSRSSRSVTTQPGNSQQRSSSYNKSGSSRSQSKGTGAGQSYSRPQSSQSGTSSKSTYQRSSRSGNSSGSGSSTNRQSQVKSSRSSSDTRNPGYTPSKSRNVESSSGSAKSSRSKLSVSGNSRSSGSSAVRKSSVSRKEQKSGAKQSSSKRASRPNRSNRN
jgi:hypothetical protein